MRRQLLLQQFLSGLRDKQAKFAVEYFKEPCTIEDAVHNVVTYMEAHQAPLTDSGRTTDRLSKSVRFYAHTASDADNDDSSDSEESPTHSSSHFHLPMVVERNRVLEKSKPRPLHQKQNRPVILTIH